MLKRDRARLLDCRRRVNQLPLGAAALAGSPYLCGGKLLGFDEVCENSLDTAGTSQ